jgi:hypothetical protein
MANYVETCIFSHDKEKKWDKHQPKLHIHGKGGMHSRFRKVNQDPTLQYFVADRY